MSPTRDITCSFHLLLDLTTLKGISLQHFVLALNVNCCSLHEARTLWNITQVVKSSSKTLGM